MTRHEAKMSIRSLPVKTKRRMATLRGFGETTKDIVDYQRDIERFIDGTDRQQRGAWQDWVQVYVHYKIWRKEQENGRKRSADRRFKVADG